jgi:hypothetical protein
MRLPEAEIIFRSHLPPYPHLQEAQEAGGLLVARPDPEPMVSVYPCGKGGGWIASPAGEILTAEWIGSPHALLVVFGPINPLAPSLERLPWPLMLVHDDIFGTASFARTDGWCKVTAAGWRAYFAIRRRYTDACYRIGRHVVRLPWVQYPEGERFSWLLLFFALCGGKPRTWYAWQSRKAGRIMDRLLRRTPR